MKPWDHTPGSHEAARILRWTAALAETHARTHFDGDALQIVLKARRRVEDLLAGASTASLASPETADGLAFMLEVAGLAAEPWGGDRLDGVMLAAEVLGRVGLIELAPPPDTPSTQTDDLGETRDSAETVELPESDAPTEAPAAEITETEPI